MGNIKQGKANEMNTQVKVAFTLAVEYMKNTKMVKKKKIKVQSHIYPPVYISLRKCSQELFQKQKKQLEQQI